MKILSFIHYFLGIEIHPSAHGLLLNQANYARDLLDTAQMTYCKQVSTPMAPKDHKGSTNDTPFNNPTLYRSIAGALQYLTFTRLDLSFSVNFVYQFMHTPNLGTLSFGKTHSSVCEWHT